MKEDKNHLFHIFFSWMAAHSLFFSFFFSLLAAYKEGCFGQIFNMVPKEISRHSFMLFVLSSRTKSYHTPKILKL